MTRSSPTKRMSAFTSLLLMVLLIWPCKQFNASACGYIELNSLYFFVNKAADDRNIESSTDNQIQIYNLCHQHEYWCQSQFKTLSGSMVVLNDDCSAFKQESIQPIDPKNLSAGIKISYINKEKNDKKWVEFPCKDQNKIGCPEVVGTTVWAYFEENSLSYTIVVGVVGVLFMVLGVYLYRVTTVMIGWATSFLLLLLVEQSVVFRPGVPTELLSDVMLLSILCCFLVGYVLAYFPKSGLFCMGMWIGLIFSLILNNIALYLIDSDPPTLPLFITLPVLCLFFGIVTLLVKKSFIIFATSLIGAYIFLRALSLHLGAFPNEFLYSRQYQLGLQGTVNWQFYLYVVSLLVLTASSSALQFWLFKKKISKTHESADIDQHFNKMADKMENQRENLADFHNIFNELKSHATKEPRVLKKQNQEYEMSSSMRKRQESFSSISMSSSQSEQESENSKQRRERLEREQRANELHENLLASKANKGRKRKY